MDPQALFDQTIEVGRELARAVRDYYEQMLALGFDEKQALDLAIGYQSALLVTAKT